MILILPVDRSQKYMLLFLNSEGFQFPYIIEKNIALTFHKSLLFHVLMVIFPK